MLVICYKYICAVYYLATTVVEDTLFYNVTAFNGLNMMLFLYCETAKCSKINCLIIIIFIRFTKVEQLHKIDSI